MINNFSQMFDKKTRTIFPGVLFVLLSISTFQGCKHDPMSSTEEICFNTDVQPIIISNCAYTGCHDAASRKDGVDLSNFEKMISTAEVEPGNANKSELYEVLMDTGEDQMPPSGKLSDAEIQIIYDWIEQGAQNITCESNGCDTTKASFADDILPITNAFCKSCHSVTNPSESILLTDFKNISAAAADGSLVGSIKGSNGFNKMPEGSTLDECQIALIEKWVKEGMLDN
jgi:mono/diheme cytochrome c family protein